jgi:hypothetical protein
MIDGIAKEARRIEADTVPGWPAMIGMNRHAGCNATFLRQVTRTD